MATKTEQTQTAKKVFIVSQGKGGVGKSTIATMLASYLLEKGEKVKCVDTDGVNLTFSAYKALCVVEKNILGEDYQTADLKKIDDFFSDILENETNETIIVDIGASSFLPVRGYIFNNEIHKMIDIDITFVLPICGGASEDTTMLGINDTVADFKTDCSYLVVQNERDGKLRFANSNLEKKMLEELKEKYLGDVVLPKIHGILASDFEIVTKNKLIFSEFDKCKELKILNRQRLKIFYNKFFEQLKEKGI